MARYLEVLFPSARDLKHLGSSASVLGGEFIIESSASVFGDGFIIEGDSSTSAVYLVGSALTMCGSEGAVSVERDCFIQHRAIEATGVSRCIADHRAISGKGNLEQHDPDFGF